MSHALHGIRRRVMGGLRRAARCLAPASLALLLTACAAAIGNPLGPSESPNDPLEPGNRKIHEFNTTVRTAVLRPAAEAYNSAPLSPIRTGLSNVLGNLREPLVFVNDVAQGRGCAAITSLHRFVINSTFGVAGLMDIARTHAGIEAHDNDFGQTLAVWGVPEGPYLVLPILGPSSVRGVAGITLDYVFDPTDLVLLRRPRLSRFAITRAVVDVFDKQAAEQQDLDKLERTSLDAYASLRSAYRQYQTAQIERDGCSERAWSTTP